MAEPHCFVVVIIIITTIATTTMSIVVINCCLILMIDHKYCSYDRYHYLLHYHDQIQHHYYGSYECDSSDYDYSPGYPYDSYSY